ncbi:MAG: hypothetical protein V4487_05390 [Chlamydiota bacterium]
MSAEIGIDPAFFLDYTSWMLETGLWNGRPITWKEAPAFQNEIETKIVRLLFSQDPSSLQFQQMAIWLAQMGTLPENQAFLARDIQALKLSPHEVFVQAGLGKFFSNLWKNHKTEIIIGLGVVGVVGTIVVVSAYSGGAATGAAVAAGGAVLDGLLNSAEPDRPSPNTCPVQKQKEPPAQPNTIYLDNGVLINGRFFSHREIFDPSHRESFYSSLNPNYVNSTPSPSGPPHFFHQAELPPPLPPALDRSRVAEPLRQKEFDPVTSSTLSLQNLKDLEKTALGKSPCRIGGINGMNTSPAEAAAHAEYLKTFTSGRDIDWVYNRTHGPALDLAEIFTLNYLGNSPNTAEKLRGNWSSFHEENKENPKAKYLQFCHSQGAIHVRNALLDLPKEIANRVIVVAIAPGAIVPRELCFNSFNYASKGDIVPFGELFFAGALDTNEFGTTKLVEIALETNDRKAGSYNEAAKKAMPSVVNIFTSKEVKVPRQPLMDDPLFVYIK